MKGPLVKHTVGGHIAWQQSILYTQAVSIEHCLKRLTARAPLGLNNLFFDLMFRLIQMPEGITAKTFMEPEIFPMLRDGRVYFFHAPSP